MKPPKLPRPGKPGRTPEEMIARIDDAVASVEAGLASMEHANALIERHGLAAAPFLVAIGFAAPAAAQLSRPDELGRFGFPDHVFVRQRSHLAELAASRVSLLEMIEF